MEKMILLYNRLQDELSRKIFWARLQFEAEPGIDQAFQLRRIGQGATIPQISWRERLTEATKGGKKLVLYGAGAYGGDVARNLLKSHFDFFAFCDRDKAGRTYLGKTILSPSELVSHSDLYVVVITTIPYYEEVYQYLSENKFPSNNIIKCPEIDPIRGKTGQYYEFPELFKPGTAIVDGGCFDGMDTIEFSKWCGGRYSQIYAFEPDPVNYLHCKANIEAAGVPNVTVFQAGLGDAEGKFTFACDLSQAGHLIERTTSGQVASKNGSQYITVQVYALDDIADVEIGLIKMDIEGAEIDALRGAKHVIQRDKPQMAICVYHRKGDMLAIMDYLHNLVPEYRFWLRHYGSLDFETVLYAAI